MKSLLNKDNIKHIKLLDNKFGLTERDLIGKLKAFPLGIVVRMLEEQEKQGNKPNVKVFQADSFAGKEDGGFDWKNTANGYDFWDGVIYYNNFKRFYKNYPKYKKYDIQ